MASHVIIILNRTPSFSMMRVNLGPECAKTNLSCLLRVLLLVNFGLDRLARLVESLLHIRGLGPKVTVRVGESVGSLYFYIGNRGAIECVNSRFCYM